MKSRTAPKYYLCSCLECFQCTSICPGTQSVVKGRYLDGPEHRRHEEKQRLVGVQILPEPTPESSGLLSPGHSDTVVDDFQRSFQERASSRSNRRQRRASSKPFTKPSDDFLTKLGAIQLRLDDYSRSAFQGQLKFCIPPSIMPPSERMDHQLRLDESALENQDILRFERWVDLARGSIANGAQSTAHIRIKKAIVLERLERASRELIEYKSSQWRQQREEAKKQYIYEGIDTSSVLTKSYSSWPSVILLTYLVVASLCILSRVPLKVTSDVLQCIRGALKLSDNDPADAPYVVDARTVLKRLSLAEPPHKAVACCPRCWATYPFEPGQIKMLPLRCSARQTSESAECGATIRKITSKERDQVEKEFLYHDFKQWLAWMFCREDIADELEWDPLSDDERNTGVLNDIWDGSILRDLQGPGDEDGRFVVKLPGERRLVFSFNYDSLNPYGNRVSGKSVKVTGMYLACLSLRRKIRFLVENVFLVGVIPGPDAPATSQVNHIIRLLVDDFLALWFHGVFFSRTLRHAFGLRVRCAIVPIVCDLPAARQLSGNASATSEQQCNECDLPLNEVDNIDYKNWPIRSKEEHVRLAAEWKACATIQEQDLHWSQHHVRWSEFLRLPYWDPTKHVVIDSMHGFYLGLFNRHCRVVWGMDASKKDSSGINDEPSNIPKPLMDASRSLLRHGARSSLQIMGLDVLRQLCREGGLRYSLRFTKQQLLDSLVTYRISKAWFDAEDNYLGDDGQVAHPPDTMTEAARIVFESGTKSYITNQLRLPLAREICRRYLGLSDVDGMTLTSLKETIREERYQRGFTDERHQLIHTTAVATKRGSILGRSVCRNLSEDISRTSLPTWVSQCPKEPGMAKEGSLKADEWKTLCTVHLPITLIRLWGSSPAGSLQQEMLSNFMDLVHAVRLATLRQITSDQVDEYEHYMHSYLTKLLDLYPETSIAPYQHLSLHFGDHLRRWGPTHSWRCFAFERFNGLMQNIQTNSKFGQLEGTIFRRFCAGQRLRALFNEYSLPAEVQPYIDKLSTMHKSNIRATFMQENLEFTDGFTLLAPKKPKIEDLDKRTHKLLVQLIASRGTVPVKWVPVQVMLVDGLVRLGKTFRPMSGDSQIIFNGARGPSAGRIRSIFKHTRRDADGKQRSQTFLHVDRLREPLSIFDPYQQFSAGGRLYQHADINHEGVVITCHDIICHFAQTTVTIEEFPEPLLHVLPLEHVIHN